MQTKIILTLLLTILLINACNKDKPDDDDNMNMDNDTTAAIIDTLHIDFTNVPFDNLSEYGFFEDLTNLVPHKALLPYDINTTLFSNYATKQRLLYMPIDAQASYHSNGQETLDFPDETIIIKTFYYENDFTDSSQGKRLLETRLLIRQDGEWIPASYHWNEDQTEAVRSVVTKVLNVDWIHFDGSERNEYYVIPKQDDCKGCHSLNEEMVLIGPKAHYLNKDYDYTDGTMNQLKKWESMGKLTGLPTMSEVPTVAAEGDVNASIDSRARAYLDINCGHCHNEYGPANNSGLFLDIYQTDSFKLGFCKPPVAAGGGSGGLEYGIVPGNPDESIMIYRLNSLEPDVSMPELARSVIHEEGLQLLRDWIETIEGDCD